MKSAMELMGSDYDSRAEVISTSGPPSGRPIGQVTYQLTVEQLALVAQRAREEAFEMAAQTAIDAGVGGYYDESAALATIRIEGAIRALKGKP